jgi:hypothetical protein
MPPDGYIKVIKPAGGETYKYGDTMTVIWMTDIDSSIEAVVAVKSPAYFDACDYTPTEEEWFRWPRDTTLDGNNTAGMWSYIDRTNQIALGWCKVPIIDTTIEMSVCDIKWQGDSLKIKIWDPYADICIRCLEEGAYSDGFFSVDRN